jgi:UbiD family decarboxylase
MKAAIVMGSDPITWAMSSSKVAPPGADELEFAGAFMGQPLEVVKCETSDILVPAHAEMVVEGEIPLTDMDEEGPFGEMYGYLGLKKDKNFYMNIECITHREKPWILNSYTGVTRGYLTAPIETTLYFSLKRTIHNLLAVHTPTHATGFVVVQIDKRAPGDGMAAGMQVAGNLNIAKATIVVDSDIDPYDFDDVMAAVGARWQPGPASLIVDGTRGMRLDPSAANRELGSKIVIDATKKLPSEGGPAVYPKLNRALLEELAPDAFAQVESKWDVYVEEFERRKRA